MEANPETTELKNMVQNLNDLVVQISKDVNRELSVSRHNFLKLGVGSFLGLISMQHLQSSAWTQLGGIAARAKHCIVLFMNDGASQLDTFDPKPDILNAGPFAAIPASAEGIRIFSPLLLSLLG